MSAISPVSPFADLKPGDHVCALYGTEAELGTLLTAWLRPGLEQNQKCLCLLDIPAAGANPADWLVAQAAGLELHAALAHGQVICLSPAAFYLAGHSFDLEALLDRLAVEIGRAQAEGYAALRIFGQMTWARRGQPGFERLCEYEIRMHHFLPGQPALALGAYDQRQFEAETLLTTLHAHPLILTSGEVCDNLYYRPPDEVLQQQPAEAILDDHLRSLAHRQQAEHQIRTQQAQLQTQNEALRAQRDELALAAVTLRESESRLRFALEGTNDGLWDVQMATNAVYLSPRGCEMLGYAADELPEVARVWSQLVHPDDLAHTQARLNAYLEGRAEIFEVEQRLRLKNGGWKWMLARGKVVTRDAAGQPLRMTGTHTDISARVAADQARREAEQRVQEQNEQLLAQNQALRTHQEQLQQTEATLRENELRYQSLFENMQQGFAYCRMLFEAGQPQDFIYLAVNAAFGRLTGLDHVVGRPVSEVIPGIRASDAALIELYGRVALTGRPETAEIYLAALQQWFAISVYSPRPEHFAAIFDVITERKHMETALRESEARFRSLFHNHSAVMLLIDPGTGAILEANPAAEAFYGYSQQQFAQLSIEAINALPSPTVKTARQRILCKETSHFVFPHRLANGEVRTVEVYSSPIAVSGQTVLFSIIHDITERQQAEAALRESERRLLEAQAVAHVGNWEMNLANGTVWASDEVFRVYGLERTAPVLPVSQAQAYAHPDDQQFMEQALRTLLQEGQVANTEFRLFRKSDGVLRVVQAWGNVMLDAAGIPQKVTGVLQDITERKQAEDQIRELNTELEKRVAARTAELTTANAGLLQASRLKDEFLANMSHELRTPLTAILGLSEALQMGSYGPLPDRQAKMLQVIRQSGQHLLTLITDILDLSKIEAGKVDVQLTPVAVAEICEASFHFIRQPAQKKNLGLQVVLDPQVRLVLADARRLKQMLVNLLNNAVKFTPQGGQVGLEVTGDPIHREVCFTVWDSGIGIPPEKLALLFQPFVQVDGSLSRRYEGTGLGLALTRRLAEMHGGRVEVDSAGTDQGSRFTVTLPWRAVDLSSTTPVSSPAPAPQEPAREAIAPHWDHPPVILVADDNEATRMALSDFLQSLPARIVTACHGEEALTRAQATPPDLIVMDIQMPGLDGLEAIRQLKAAPQTARIPIIALTALAMPGDRERCLAAGANAYLSKPVKLAELVRAITQLLADPADNGHPQPRPE